MSQSAATAQAGLAGLSDRLAGGVCPAARRGRSDDWQLHDSRALSDTWPSDALGVIRSIRESNWAAVFTHADPIAHLVTHLVGHHDLLRTVVLSPAVVLDHMLSSEPQQADPAGSWIRLCWIAEAAWSVVTSDPPEIGHTADYGLLAPMAARLRFLTLSEPMRWRGHIRDSWWWKPADMKVAASKNGLVDRTFGGDSWHLVVERCREARRDWRDYLNTYQSRPLLALTKPGELEQELIALVFRHQAEGEPLVISVRSLSESADLTAEDASMTAEVTEQHLLPRFNLLSVASLAGYAPHRWGRIARVGFSVATSLAGVGAVICTALLAVPAALALAIVCYTLISAGVVSFGSRWAALWLLRLPAASAVGLFALISLLPGSWLHTPHAGWVACVTLAGAAYGYLVIEARNHGVSSPAALRRSAGVALIGAVHALLVSLIGLIAIAPAFDGQGSVLAALWRHPGYGHVGMLFLLATTWCLAVGVFSQILWDDRPITAPLAHLQWRSGR